MISINVTQRLWNTVPMLLIVWATLGLSLNATTVVPVPAYSSVYKAIKEQYSRSIKEEKLQLSDNDTEKNEGVTQDDYERLLFDLFAHNEVMRSSSIAQAKLPITSPLTWYNLNLFCGSKLNPRATLLSRINRCSTTMGKVVLARFMATPTTDIDALSRRQQVIRSIAENDGLYENLKKQLEKIKETEHTLYNFWLAKAQPKKNPFNIGLYFAPFMGSERLGIPPGLWKALNRSDFALSTSVLMKRTKFTTIGTSVGLWLATIYQVFKLKAYDSLWEKQLVDGVVVPNLDRPIAGRTYAQAVAEEFSPGRFGSNLLTPGKTVSTIWDAVQKMFLITFFQALYYGLRDIKEDFFETHDIVLDAKKQLNGLAGFIHSFSLLHNTLALFPAITQDLGNFESLTATLNHTSRAHELNNLLNVLSSDQFKGKAQFDTFWSGPVLRAFKLMHETKHQFNNALEAIGEIDAIVSLATLYRESKKSGNPFTFAQYRTSNTPYLKFNNFWNPFIKPDSAVPNDLELGNLTQGQNAILSGPNAGGKSTYMKGALLTALFAQTLTIVPAQSAELTPFSYLDTYINVEQEPALGHSQFRAEIERMKEIINNVKMLAPSQFALSVLDEFGSGTNPFDATDITQAIGEFLVRYENSLWVLATHFDEVTDLTSMTHGMYKNYKVLVNRTTNGAFAGYPFKVEPGTTTESTAFDVLALAQFDSRIIKRAQELREAKKTRRESFKSRESVNPKESASVVAATGG